MLVCRPPVALYPPDSDPITTRATSDVAGDVIALDDNVADALFADAESGPTGAVVVSVLVDPPARRNALWIGPFTGQAEARIWMDRRRRYCAHRRSPGDDADPPATRADAVPETATAAGPDSEPVTVEEVS